MDSDVNNISALAVDTQVVADTGNPPNAATNAVWSSSGLYLQTRPTGNRYIALMGKFVNNTGTNATQIRISYLLTTTATSGSGEDAGKGTRVYYSLTGLAGSWSNISSLNSLVTTESSSNMSATVSLAWPNGGSLYLLWADDNATAVDTANQIDNFSLQVTAGSSVSLNCFLAAPANNSAVAEGSPIPWQVTIAGGIPPYNVLLWTNSGIGNLGFTIAKGSLSDTGTLAAMPIGTYNIYAWVMDDDGMGNTVYTATNTFVVVSPMNFALTSPADNSTIDTAVSVEATTTVTGGTAPYSVQFFLDGVPHGAPVASAPYSHTFGSLFVGDHTIRATVTDAFGWTSNSLASTVHITGPLAALLSPTNGASITFGQPLTLSAFVAGGTAPYSVNFYTNSILAGSVSSSPYSLNLGILNPGTYNVSAKATDSSSTPQQFTTAANAITITPNPIVVSLNNPTNGQSASAGVAILLSASAGVSAPLTVTNVEFFVDGISAANDSTAPYSTSVTVATAGSHSFYAIAKDNLGRQSYSSTNLATFTVNPLANDNFENRIALGTPGYATGSNVGATTQSGEPTQTGGFGGTTLGATMWYKWTAPADGSVTISTAGSSFNTTLWVFTGSAVNALTQVAFNDNVSYQNQSSLLTFSAQQGTEYEIQVGGAQQGGGRGGITTIATGNFNLNLTMPPSVSLTSPANNSLVMLGSNLVLSANASSGAGVVTQVDFYDSTRTLLGSAFSAPYSIVASNLPSGSNSFYAVVRDSLSQTSTSSIVSVLVMAEGITVTSPLDGSLFQNQNPITVNVSSLLKTGSITNVVVYVDGVEIGSDASAPFSVTWNNVTPGAHTISATGTSETGMTYTDGRVHIAVINYIMAASSIWKYLDNGSDQGTEWASTNFDDSSWAAGPAPLGWGYSSYGWNNYRYPATTNSSGYITTYYRQTVVIDDPAKYTSFTLGVQRDDGVVIYLNGNELVRQNISSSVTVDYMTTASSAYDNGSTTYITTLSPNVFVPGTNYFAVELHQDSVTSSDAWFQMELSGMPRVIHNEAPIVSLDSPANNSTHLAAGLIMLSATATDADGTVTNVSFFEGGTKLGQVAAPPYTLTVLAEEPGVYSLNVAATDDQGATTVSAPITITVYPSSSRWVAYNDHYAGPGTHPNATAWNPFGTLAGAPGEGGPLRNIQTGTQLSSHLTITNFGATGITQCGAPLPGTPAYNLFNGYVDFGSNTVNNGILVNNSGKVVYLFTGLNPSRQYNLRATVAGGLTGSSNRWTLLSISNATAFIAAHTTNVLTSATQSALAANEAALNTGDNSTGEVIGWDHIVPGQGGSFVIVATQYLGPAPGNDVPAAAAYAPVAIRLEELGANPIVTVTKPLADEVIMGPTNVITAAEPISILPITNMIFLGNGNFIGQTNQAPYTVSWSNPPFGSLDFQAIAIDAEGYCTTSAPVTMTLITPPTNTIPPMVYGQSPLAETVVTNYLTNILVVFSQPVVNVDARDLLVNDVPAFNVVNFGGTNFLFSVAQPAYGSVRVRFAPDHGITDLSWPNHLAFYENDIGASWNYTLVDRIPPTIVSKTPTSGSFVTNVSQLTVTFSKPVIGVDAGDLKVNGVPCYGLSGSGTTYTFYCSQPRSGNVSVMWVSGHGITDLSTPPNPFGGSGWIFTLDSRTILIQTNTAWALFKGSAEASGPTNAWTVPGFDQSAWTIADAPFYYGDSGYTNDNAAGTPLQDMPGNYSSIYLRKTFVIKNAAAVTNLQLLAQIDDGFVAWINGYEVKRYNVNLSGDLPYNGLALSSVLETTNNAAGWSNFALPNPKLYLIDGTNDLAIHAFNYALTDDDFGFNAQLFTYLPNTEVQAPRVAAKSPSAGYVYSLTNITVAFSEQVTNVDASDLLINGVPATSVSVSNNIAFTFTLSQPAYGPVAISWAPNHDIVDLDATPKPFDDSLGGGNWQYTLLNPSAPHLVSVAPVQGSNITNLSEISMSFNEPVTGLDASDLLINGVPATGLTGDGVNFTFTLPQPPYGIVYITWAANHGITDTETPSNPFDTLWPNHVFTYTLEDKTPPAVALLNPPAGSFVTSLTQITVTFTEPVAGVDAFDLLINNHPATSVSKSSETYTFTFPAQNASQLLITWSATHGIHDLSAASNLFNATATGNTWSYQAMDTTAPNVASVYPPASATARALTNVEVTFDEPVSGVAAGSLLMNNKPALEVSGTGAGPYAFIFAEPATGLVQVAWAPNQQIYDLASTPNRFAGGSWNYVYNPDLNLSFAVSHVVHISLDGVGAYYLQNYLNTISLPTYEKLRSQGSSTLNARCDYTISVTLPNHACMFTGRPAQQPSGWANTTYHGLTIDSDNGTTIHSAGNPNVPYKSSLFDVAHDNGLSTAFLYSKQSLTFFARSWNGTYGAADTIGIDNGSNKIDFVFNSTPNGSSYGPTEDVVNEFVAHVETNGLWGYTFLHFDDGDAVGHASNWGSDAYQEAVINTDTQIGRVLDAIQSNPSYSNTTILIVTADHGGGAPTNSHTTATSFLDYTVPIFVLGPGIPAGTDLYDIMANRADPGSNRYAYSDTSVIQPLHNGDTGNLGLSFLGLPSIPGSSLIPVIGSKSVSLTMSQSGDTVTVSWPSYAVGQLKVSSTLGSGANWQTVTSGITTVGNLKIYSFTPAPGAPVQFFSLQK